MPRDDERDDRYDDDQRDGREREYEERDRYSREKKSSTNTVLLIVGGIGCLIVLVCGGLIAAGIWMFATFSKSLIPATSAAEHFLSLLQEDKVDQAYELTSKEYQRNNSREQFSDFLKQFETFKKHTSRQLVSANIFTNNNGTRAVIKMTLKSQNNAMTCTLVLVEEQDKWKVNQLTVP